MTSLVERLRKTGHIDYSLLDQAADRIEELERENAELREWRLMLGKQLQSALADCTTARREVLEEATQIAEREYKRHCTGSGFDSQPARSTAYSILESIRALSDSSPTLLQEQNTNAASVENGSEKRGEP